MKNLTKLTASGSFAYVILLVSKAHAAGPESGWPYTVAPRGVPTELETTVINITNYILGFISLIAVLVIIYGGILYLISAGNQDSIDKAKKTIANGIIGLIICGLAYAIVVVITGTLLGGGA